MDKAKRLKRLSVQGVYVMPDYSSTCLWDYPDGGMVYPREIGLSCKIVKALEDFERYYDDVATGRPSYNVLKRYEVKLNLMGKKIAQDIKDEKPDLEVWYWGEYAGGKLKKEMITGARSSAGTEHLPYKQRVGGSNPLAPTKSKRKGQ
jgi:hypothetical protein